MRLKSMPVPALPEDAVSWRALHLAGAFEQRSLIGMSALASLAQDRGITIALRRPTLEEWDRIGALRPVAFGLAGWTDHVVVDPDRAGTLALREDATFRPWDQYSYEIDTVTTVSPLYTPWQLLSLADAFDARAWSWSSTHSSTPTR